MPHKPDWFRDGEIFVSYAPTVGINKDGDDLFVVDPMTGTRTKVIDNRVAEDIEALMDGRTTPTSRWVPLERLTDRMIGVPVYFDDRPTTDFESFMSSAEDLNGFGTDTLGTLIKKGFVQARAGHGSPSADMRAGTVPYIKVSDLRAGQVNINPTNRVSEIVARRFWRGDDSSLSPYDLLTPLRTSKNIGDFAVLMPGQERVVLTKEILVLHAAEDAPFDNFYLLWAMSLKAVRRQWDRIVFMQTNREDAGKRYLEIEVPVPPDRKAADAVCKEFREYYKGMEKLRADLLARLDQDGRHHIYMSSAEGVADDEDLDMDESDTADDDK